MQTVGKGKVYAGQNAEAALKAMNVAPDFDYSKPEQRPADPLRAPQDSPTAISISSITAATGCVPSTPASASPARLRSCGTRRPARASCLVHHRRRPHHLPLHFEPWGTVFVVFRKPTKETSRTASESH